MAPHSPRKVRFGHEANFRHHIFFKIPFSCLAAADCEGTKPDTTTTPAPDADVGTKASKSNVGVIVGVSIGTMLFNDVHTPFIVPPHPTYFLLEPLPLHAAALILIGGCMALFMRHRMRRMRLRNYQVLSQNEVDE